VGESKGQRLWPGVAAYASIARTDGLCTVIRVSRRVVQAYSVSHAAAPLLELNPSGAVAKNESARLFGPHLDASGSESVIQSTPRLVQIPQNITNNLCTSLQLIWPPCAFSSPITPFSVTDAVPVGGQSLCQRQRTVRLLLVSLLSNIHTPIAAWVLSGMTTVRRGPPKAIPIVE